MFGNAFQLICMEEEEDSGEGEGEKERRLDEEEDDDTPAPIGFEVFHIGGGTASGVSEGPQPGADQDRATLAEICPNANLDTPTSHHSPETAVESTFTFDASGFLLVSTADSKSLRLYQRPHVFGSRCLTKNREGFDH